MVKLAIFITALTLTFTTAHSSGHLVCKFIKKDHLACCYADEWPECLKEK